MMAATHPAAGVRETAIGNSLGGDFVLWLR
jgi:hypothetical protein